jgi:hypothetical protein
MDVLVDVELEVELPSRSTGRIVSPLIGQSDPQLDDFALVDINANGLILQVSVVIINSKWDSGELCIHSNYGILFDKFTDFLDLIDEVGLPHFLDLSFTRREYGWVKLRCICAEH